LEVRSRRATDGEEVERARRELAALTTMREQLPAAEDLAALVAELTALHERIWHREQELQQLGAAAAVGSPLAPDYARREAGWKRIGAHFGQTRLTPALS